MSRLFGAGLDEHYTGTKSPGDSNAALNAYGTLVARQPSIEVWGHSLDGAGPYVGELTITRTAGLIPMMTMGFNTHHDYFCDYLASGAYDSAIVSQYCSVWSSFNQPLIIRPMWEMSGSWYQWGVMVNGNTPAKYVAAWQHLVTLIRANSPKVEFYWCPYVPLVSSTMPLLKDYGSFYPGDAYVDWVGYDAYPVPGGSTNNWDLHGGLYKKCCELSTKPILIGEWGAREDSPPTIGKAAWITDFFDVVKKRMPRVAGHMYYDVSEPSEGGANGFPINSSVSATNAYAAGVADTVLYKSNVYSALASPIPLPTGPDIQGAGGGVVNTWLYSDGVGTTTMRPKQKVPARIIDHVSTGNWLDIQGNGATSPNQAAFTTTDTYDVRVRVALDSYVSGAYQSLLAQSGSIGAGNFRYTFRVDSTGHLRWDHYDNSNVIHSYTSTALIGAATAQSIWLRALVDPLAGSVAFYTSQDGATWTQLGSTVTGSATTIRLQATPGVVQAGLDAFPSPAYGRLYRVVLIVGGVTRLSMNWETATPAVGAYNVPVGPWTGAAGETWSRASLIPNVYAGGVRTTMTPNVIGSGSSRTMTSTGSSSSAMTPSIVPPHYLQVGAGSGADTPHISALNSGTASIDLRAKVTVANWASGGFQTIIGQEPSTALSALTWHWWFGITATGGLYAEWVNTAAGAPGGNSTAVTGFAAGATRWVRVVMTIAAGTINFYTSTDGVTWTPLGSQLTGKSPTALASITGTPVAVGSSKSNGSSPLSGKVYRAQVILGGVSTLDMNFESALVGSGPWVADTGETWTALSGAVVASQPALISVGSSSTSMTATKISAAANYLAVPSGGGATTPDQAAAFTTTDVYDVRVRVALDSWANGAYQAVFGQTGIISNGDFRYTFRVAPTGKLRWDSYDAANTIHTYLASTAVAFASGQPGWVRVVFDPTASSATFYTSPDGPTPTWTQLGSTITAAATTIRTQTTPGVVKIGNDAFPSPALGKYYEATLLVAGVTYLDIDFTAVTPGTGPWTDSVGKVWTRVGTSSVMAPSAGGATLTSVGTSTSAFTADVLHSVTLASSGTSSSAFTRTVKRSRTLASSGAATTTMTATKITGGGFRNVTSTSNGASTTTMTRTLVSPPVKSRTLASVGSSSTLMIPTDLAVRVPKKRLARSGMGCGEYRVAIYPKGGGQQLAEVEWSSLSWGRKLDATSSAQINVAGISGRSAECCGIIGAIEPWRHELGILRSGQRIWCGPVQTVSYDPESNAASITANDISFWLTRRLLVNDHVYTREDLAVIFSDYVYDAMIQDNSPGLLIAATLCGVKGDRVALASGNLIASDQISELSRTGVDWTVIDRYMVVGGLVVPQVSSFTLVDEHFMVNPASTKDGSYTATEWSVVGGTPVGGGEAPVGVAGGIDPAYGLIARVAREDTILDASSAYVAATGRLALTAGAPGIITDGVLSSDAPVDLLTLLPGTRCAVRLRQNCVPVNGEYRLSQIDVAVSDVQAEQVKVSFQPVGIDVGSD